MRTTAHEYYLLVLVRLSLSTFPFPFPQFHLCVAYNVLLRTRIRINTPRMALPKGRQIGSHFPFVFVCVSRQPRPLLSRLVSVGTHYCLAVGNNEGLELDEADED